MKWEEEVWVDLEWEDLEILGLVGLEEWVDLEE
eukprot:CAMPEP_0202950126 /NCGR_PEP_ID=MMETSP1395-20130829/19385_1 /ASSEMBLY_ACC=CAM_ASM_000871 /TAXON_ID=5961 /ORGANISM="Blepharisma japonicum, Strain Stock R1072" /LENGTH=32 /DNA_ID= /DNA_START= /DNA_END= /DNA_ORIENTATION=